MLNKKLGFLPVFLLSVACWSCANSGMVKDPSDKAKNKYFTNPVFEPVLADPTIVHDEQTGLFYAYGTEDNWADGNAARLVPILESTNLSDWTYVGEAFQQKPTWKKEGWLWAPDINYIHDKYYLYYSMSTWGDDNPGIGLAIADSPKGPFVDQGKLFTSKEIDVPNSIDPFYMEEDGKEYLFWGSFDRSAKQGTFAVKLKDKATKVKSLQETTKIAAGDFEAVMIHKKDGYYYFFGSKGSCCDGANSKYHVLVGRSENLLGPYYDKEGNDLRDRKSGTVAMKGNDIYAGPGHNSRIFTDKGGKDWILYHAIRKEQDKLKNGTSRRVLMLDEVHWEDGWPIVHLGEPSQNQKEIPSF
ncbi:family 43 glycosylhydrolase [Sphingobacterium chuzhouense]|uniref:Family 43 glycosylhydrolase n=1 Tax=Sphingobacterium chuzhouense TaxID=1742264 RepID=A0ABR7XNH0_9SPHI|nr:family 43 glycosylhydrolase [Sphingobacterium chuzhouense]MBD1420720.1 family 43 glycosylhydrolase [Sphingobacterium chuzhouense]